MDWRRPSQLIVCIAGLTCLVATTASAGIPIPCTGEKIVKVAELPADVVGKDGRHFDLGYMHSWCFGGEFVGYLGEGRQYLKFNDEFHEHIRSSGISAPGFWASAWANKGQFWVEWLWLGLFGCMGGAALKNKLIHGSFTHPRVIAQREAAAAAKASTTPTSANGMAAGRMARSMVPAGGAPGFGKR